MVVPSALAVVPLLASNFLGYAPCSTVFTGLCACCRAVVLLGYSCAAGHQLQHRDDARRVSICRCVFALLSLYLAVHQAAGSIVIAKHQHLVDRLWHRLLCSTVAGVGCCPRALAE